MADDSVNIRIVDLKEDFKETKADVKELSKSMILIEKSIIRSEAAQEKMLTILANNKIILDDNAKKLLATENLTINLKSTTDDLKTTTTELAERMDAMNLEITTIKELPYKNYIRMKWIFITTMAGSAYALLSILWDKVLKRLID